MGVARIVLGRPGNGRIAKLPVSCESGMDSQRRWIVDAASPREDHVSRIELQVLAFTCNKRRPRPRLKETGRVHSDLRKSVKYFWIIFISSK